MKSEKVVSACVIFLVFLLWGCEAENRFSTSYPCFFNLDLSLHADKRLLQTAVVAPMSFVSVDVSLDAQGFHHLHVESANGRSTEDILITAEKENRSIGTVGAGQGLIVGCGTNTADADHGRRAYDRQCTACIQETGMAVYPLSFVGSGMQVKCSNCGRTYELDYGTSDRGDKIRLMEYVVEYKGTVLSVRNIN